MGSVFPFRDDEIILEFDIGDGVKLCEYSKSHR
jgi:hypothetical protein